jgi:hypothetical protein
VRVPRRGPLGISRLTHCQTTTARKIQPIASGDEVRKPDHELRIHYTSAVDADDVTLGSMGERHLV